MGKAAEPHRIGLTTPEEGEEQPEQITIIAAARAVKIVRGAFILFISDTPFFPSPTKHNAILKSYKIVYV
jgi:hypothetical protein